MPPATVVSVRGHDWKPNGTELLWWTQSQKNIDVLNGPGWVRPNWAYTGFFLTDALRDGNSWWCFVQHAAGFGLALATGSWISVYLLRAFDASLN